LSNHWPRYFALLILALTLVAIDQVTKQIAYQHLVGQSAIVILPVFQLGLVLNAGAAFGFLNDAGGWQHYLFVGLAAIFSLILLVWIWRERQRNLWLAIALACVLGGAIGNMIDRVSAGYVIDFLIFHYEEWYFPAFNVADIAITVGAIMLIIDSLLFSSR